jgi:NAD dependent epimerase/dehydratase family enzyme
MKVLIAGRSGFLGISLNKSLAADGHDIVVLTRRAPQEPQQIQWDGKTTHGWGHIVNGVDAVVNLTGRGLERWPWTKRQKQKFADSRTLPGRALASAIHDARSRPRVLLQASGVNRYGLHGQAVADESTPPADDYLAQLTLPWENSTTPVEQDRITDLTPADLQCRFYAGCCQSSAPSLLVSCPRIFFYVLRWAK